MHVVVLLFVACRLEQQAQDLHKLGTLISQGNALRDPHILIISELERNPDPDWYHGLLLLLSVCVVLPGFELMGALALAGASSSRS